MKLVINEPPIPQSRPRFNSQNKRAYEKSNIKSYKQRIGYAARKEFKKPIERDIPLEIEMKFYMPIPQYLSKVKKNRLTLEKEVKYVTKKPDLDNLLKAILDGLNGIAYFDDGQVVKLSVEKVYSFHPRTEIEIKVINDELKQKLAASNLTVSYYQKKIKKSDNELVRLNSKYTEVKKRLKELSESGERQVDVIQEYSERILELEEQLSKRSNKELKRQIDELIRISENQLKFIEIQED